MNVTKIIEYFIIQHFIVLIFVRDRDYTYNCI